MAAATETEAAWKSKEQLSFWLVALCLHLTVVIKNNRKLCKESPCQLSWIKNGQYWGLLLGPNRPHKHQDPTNAWCLESPVSWALESRIQNPDLYVVFGVPRTRKADKLIILLIRMRTVILIIRITTNHSHKSIVTTIYITIIIISIRGKRQTPCTSQTKAGEWVDLELQRVGIQSEVQGPLMVDPCKDPKSRTPNFSG